MKHILAAAVLAALSMGAPRAEGSERFPPHDHPAIIGVLSLPHAPAEERAAAVLVLPDTLGPDRRADPYVDALNAAGLMVLEVDLEAVAETAQLSLTDAAALVLQELERDPRVVEGRIALLGFGAGGRAALQVSGDVARVALYPGCAGLGPLPEAPRLIVHGDADAANRPEDCQRLGGARTEIPGAGYAWDRPPHGAEGPVLLPRPDGPGRLPATPHPDFWDLSVPLVTTWLTRELRHAE
ncbi:dienelactone hydrolase family protein [Roseococcus pinisoli]|uniref:Dienelactone hydrolase n=1 Tax=Roseococcus pinisoli TaxID=2835040 RepID=A0ABS5QIX1_9PROT|nr:hypothetical protein [Roseococcus pinisoli]MBS7813527.1 hypothetical protein [Roseococcus pinisoli]